MFNSNSMYRLAVLLLLLCSPAFGQVAQTGGGKAKPGAAGFVGAGDLFSGATAFWGLRAYSAATAGNNVVRLERNSDSTQLDFATTAAGNLDVAAITTWKGASTIVYIRKLYDQTGNGHTIDCFVCNVDGLVINLTGLGGLPTIEVLTYNGNSGMTTQSPATFTQSQPFTVSAVWQQTTDPGGVTPFLQSFGDPTWFSAYGSGPQMLEMLTNNGGVQIFTAANSLVIGTAYAVAGVYNGASSKASINGSVTNGTLNSTGMSGLLGVQTSVFIGRFGEAGIWPSALSDANLATLSTNQRAYWGF